MHRPPTTVATAAATATSWTPNASHTGVNRVSVPRATKNEIKPQQVQTSKTFQRQQQPNMVGQS